MTETLPSADIQMIQRIIPHRYPFLLVDKVVDIQGTQSAVGIKNVTMNEPHFQGHFPGLPIMPGVTIVEAMAQTAAVMVGVTLEMADKDMKVYFMAIDKCKFRRKVVPSDGAAVILERRSVFVSANAIDITNEAITRLDGAVGSGKN